MTKGELNLDGIDAIVFDLGGVIMPLRYESTILGLSELLGCDARTQFSRLKQAPLFDDFETGRIAATEFRERLYGTAPSTQRSDTHRLRYEEDFDDAWSALLQPIPEENLDLLERLNSELRLFLLSNTNEIHLERALLQYAETHPGRVAWDAHFEATHYSHLMGLRKPDSRIFRHLIDEHELEPSRTLFLDDNPDNVAAASSVGLRALHHPKNSSLTARFSGFSEKTIT